MLCGVREMFFCVKPPEGERALVLRLTGPWLKSAVRGLHVVVLLFGDIPQGLPSILVLFASSS
jgi:hypothetical protein